MKPVISAVILDSDSKVCAMFAASLEMRQAMAKTASVIIVVRSPTGVADVSKYELLSDVSEVHVITAQGGPADSGTRNIIIKEIIHRKIDPISVIVDEPARAISYEIAEVQTRYICRKCECCITEGEKRIRTFQQIQEQKDQERADGEYEFIEYNEGPVNDDGMRTLLRIDTNNTCRSC